MADLTAYRVVTSKLSSCYMLVLSRFTQPCSFIQWLLLFSYRCWTAIEEEEARILCAHKPIVWNLFHELLNLICWELQMNMRNAISQIVSAGALCRRRFFSSVEICRLTSLTHQIKATVTSEQRSISAATVHQMRMNNGMAVRVTCLNRVPALLGSPQVTQNILRFR